MTTLLTRLAALEPARLAEGARWALAALIGLGWLTLDDATVNSIATVAGVLLSAVLTEATRKRVTPTGTDKES